MHTVCLYDDDDDDTCVTMPIWQLKTSYGKVGNVRESVYFRLSQGMIIIMNAD